MAARVDSRTFHIKLCKRLALVWPVPCKEWQQSLRTHMYSAKHFLGLLAALCVIYFLLRSSSQTTGAGHWTVLRSKGLGQAVLGHNLSLDAQIELGALPLPADLAAYQRREHELEESTDLYAAARLPCVVPKAPLPMKPAREPVASHTKVGLYAHRNHDGTAMMRAILQAEALSMVPGWSGYLVRRHPTKLIMENQSWNLEFCVFVKLLNTNLVEWCKNQGAKAVYWDLLDNLAVSTATDPRFELDYRVDILTNDVVHANIYRRRFHPRKAGARKGRERAFALYHGHSNVGFLSSLRRFSIPYVCRVGLVQSLHNAMRKRMYKNGLSIGAAMDVGCQASSVWEVAVVSKW
eukprot:4053534-Amphidinium_carterae.1